MRALLLTLTLLAPVSAEGPVAEIIYGPQDFTGGTFAKPTSFQTTAHGGADAPITGYPEFAAGEAVKTVNASGPLGERVLDVDTGSGSDYSDAGLAMLGVGDLPSGEWDGTDGIIVEWDQYFSTTALTQSFLGQAMVLVARLSTLGASPDPEVGLFTGDSVVWIGFEQTSGANFFYDIYYVVNGSTVHNTSVTDVADNAWHRMKIRYKPGTVTGALVGSYFPRAADGYFEWLIDGVAAISATNIKFDIPVQSVYSSTPNLLYGAWHGFAGLLGPVTNFTIWRETDSAPDPSAGELTASNPEPCCGGSSATGPILPAIDSSWTPICDGGGTVATVADLTDAENWDD